MVNFRELAFLVVPAVLVIVILLIAPSLLTGTGAGTSNLAGNTLYKSSHVNWQFDTSSERSLSEANLTAAQIVSLSLTGQVEGEGKVQVQLIDEANNTYLIYSKTTEAPRPSAITGFASASNLFQNECVETCYLSESKSVNGSRLKITVDQGTVLKISGIVYR